MPTKPRYKSGRKWPQIVQIHLNLGGTFSACGRAYPKLWVPYKHRDLVTCKTCLDRLKQGQA